MASDKLRLGLWHPLGDVSALRQIRGRAAGVDDYGQEPVCKLGELGAPLRPGRVRARAAVVSPQIPPPRRPDAGLSAGVLFLQPLEHLQRSRVLRPVRPSLGVAPAPRLSRDRDPPGGGVGREHPAGRYATSGGRDVAGRSGGADVGGDGGGKRGGFVSDSAAGRTAQSGNGPVETKTAGGGDGRGHVLELVHRRRGGHLASAQRPVGHPVPFPSFPRTLAPSRA